jgi:hypothetical protein
MTRVWVRASCPHKPKEGLYGAPKALAGWFVADPALGALATRSARGILLTRGRGFEETG